MTTITTNDYDTTISNVNAKNTAKITTSTKTNGIQTALHKILSDKLRNRYKIIYISFYAPILRYNSPKFTILIEWKYANTHTHKYLHRYTTIRQTHAKTSILNILRHEWKFRKDEDWFEVYIRYSNDKAFYQAIIYPKTELLNIMQLYLD